MTIIHSWFDSDKWIRNRQTGTLFHATRLTMTKQSSQRSRLGCGEQSPCFLSVGTTCWLSVKSDRTHKDQNSPAVARLFGRLSPPRSNDGQPAGCPYQDAAKTALHPEFGLCAMRLIL